MRTLLLIALGVAVASAASLNSQRIVGGSVTTITQYPFTVALLYSRTGSGTFYQSCGGSILNNRSFLTTAYCLYGNIANRFRARVGSSYANSGGTVRTVSRIISHPSFNVYNADNDIAIVQVSSAFSFNNNVRAGQISGPNYYIADNQVVWSIGYGATAFGGAGSNQLRHVQIWTVNQAVCRNRHAELGRFVTDNMLCAGWLDVGGRDHCDGDSGGPILHNNIIVGVASWRERCAMPRYPSVSTRVSRYTSWIQANA